LLIKLCYARKKNLKKLTPSIDFNKKCLKKSKKVLNIYLTLKFLN
jgi:hypothetical protein